MILNMAFRLSIIVLLLISFLSNANSQYCIKISQLGREAKHKAYHYQAPPKEDPVPEKPVVSEPSSTPDSGEDNKPKVDWAYSTVDLIFLAKQEEALFKDVLEYKRSLDKKLETVNGWIADYQDSSLRGTEHLVKNIHQWSRAEAVAAHPLMSYRMIRRFSYDMNRILTNMNDTLAETTLLNKIKLFEEEFILPNRTDLEHVMDNILRIQHVYDLDATWITAGQISGIQTSVGLTGEQAFEIGSFAAKMEMFPEALNWLLSVAGRAVFDPNNRLNFQAVGKTIVEVVEKHDTLVDSIDSAVRQRYPYRFMSPLKSQHFAQSYKNFKIAELKRTRQAKATYANFLLTCNDKAYTGDQGNPLLSCWYETRINPIWQINPLKVEIQSWDPYLVQIHDVIGENMTHFLREEAVPSLARAQARMTTEDDPTDDFPSPGHNIPGTRRPTFSTTTLAPDPQNRLQALDRKIGLITRMEVVNSRDPFRFVSEDIEISVHGFGGYSYLHNDAIRNETAYNASIGDRVATFMIYLTDVDLGGETVFPLIGKAITPVKGSALFWFNYQKNGKPDNRLIHGDCPVIMGHKWIATKWIRANSNLFQRKCALDPLK